MRCSGIFHFVGSPVSHSWGRCEWWCDHNRRESAVTPLAFYCWTSQLTTRSWVLTSNSESFRRRSPPFPRLVRLWVLALRSVAADGLEPGRLLRPGFVNVARAHCFIGAKLELVRRKASAEDRRRVEIRLTAKGERHLERLAPLHRAELLDSKPFSAYMRSPKP